VVAEPDHRVIDRVVTGHTANVFEYTLLVVALRQVERRIAADAARHRLQHQGFERVAADRFEHLVDVAAARSDVSTDEVVV
jgi:hypothetical protein